MFIEAWEIPLYSAAKDAFDVKFVRTIIDSEEYAFFKTYLNRAAYNCFMSHKTDYQDVCEWLRTVTYQDREFVHYNGDVYRVVGGPTTAGMTPNDEPGKWQLEVRFDNAFLEELWKKHLRTILAYKIYQAALPQATFQGGSFGAMALVDDNTGNRGATRGEMSYLSDSLAQRIYNMVELMRNYIELNKAAIPCIEWQNSCGCGDGEALKNPHYGSRKFIYKIKTAG